MTHARPNTDTDPEPRAPLICFVLDTDLSVVAGPAGHNWPVAVVTALQTCVRRSLIRGRSSFTPAGVGPRWFVVPFDAKGTPRVAVFTGRPI